MKEPTMLFRAGDTHIIWGIPVDTKTVDAHEIDEHLAEGWHRHPMDVKNAAGGSQESAPESAPETEIHTLEQRAEAVGLKVDRRWSEAKLAQKVAEAEAAGGTQE